jgi:hypothetical protein
MEGTMAYALTSTFHRTKLYSPRPYPRSTDALGPMRGIIGWTLISALVFWVPLAVALIG